MTMSIEEQTQLLELEKLRLEVQKERQAIAKEQADSLAGTAPDLSSARWSTTALSKDGGAVLGAPMAAGALEAAAARVRTAVEGDLDSNTYTVVVATDTDFTGRHAAYAAVLDRLTSLTQEVRSVLERRTSDAPEDGPRTFDAGATLLVASLVGKAVTAAFSLARASNTLSSTAGTVDDQSASWAVAGALAKASPGAQVYLDGMVPLAQDGRISSALSELGRVMADLRVRLTELDESDPAAEPLTSLLSACTESRAALEKPAEGGPSALVAARSHEWLLESRSPVVVVKGGQTSVDQLLRERWSAKVTVVAAASISYVLLDPAQDWRVRTAGCTSGRVHLTGEVGQVLRDAT